MAFIRKEEKKGLSLPGLIDIIFLLLIFSLVTLSFSQAKVEAKRHGENADAFDLPEAKVAETVEVDEVLHTLLFQIEHIDPEDPNSQKAVFILQPDLDDSVTVGESRQIAERDSIFAVFPAGYVAMSDREFERSDACRLITESLRAYADDHFYEPHAMHSVEIRAVKTTEFRVINYIMEQVSAYGDTIPRLMWRTLTGRETGDGIQE
jgi:biopolymer transport protein ExbD